MRWLLNKAGLAGNALVAGDREGCRQVISPDWLFNGENLTISIERDNRTVYEDLAGFRRKTMADLFLRLLRHLQDPATYASHAKSILSIPN